MKFLKDHQAAALWVGMVATATLIAILILNWAVILAAV